MEEDILKFINCHVSWDTLYHTLPVTPFKTKTKDVFIEKEQFSFLRTVH